MNENDFIEWFANEVPRFDRSSLGIGDDAAILNTTSSTFVTTDMLMDGVDFDTSVHSPELIGRKSIAVNLSDIAAMGSVPTSTVISVAIPFGTDFDWLKRLTRGMIDICQSHSVEIVGGDTNSWRNPLAISATMHGVLPAGSKPILRTGARSGDWIMVSGPLGGSIFGRHLTFEPRVALAQWLASNFQINAMMDLSDGIASDLPRLCKASKVGATIQENLIPLHQDVILHYPKNQWLQHAIGDGEDFELLLTCSPSEGSRLENQSVLGSHFCKVGEITASLNVQLSSADGNRQTLKSGGYVHSW